MLPPLPEFVWPYRNTTGSRRPQPVVFPPPSESLGRLAVAVAILLSTEAPLLIWAANSETCEGVLGWVAIVHRIGYTQPRRRYIIKPIYSLRARVNRAIASESGSKESIRPSQVEVTFL